MDDVVGALGALVFLALLAGAPLPLVRACAGDGDSGPVEPGRPRAASEGLLEGVLLWLLLQMAVATGLGALGMLRLAPLLVAEAALAALGWGLLVGRRAPASAPAALRMVAAARSTPGRALGGAALGLGAALLAAVVVHVPVEYDSLWYHGPVLAHVVRHGALGAPPGVGIYPYPFGWETLSALFALGGTGDLLVGLPNVLAWVLGALAVYRLACEAGAGRWAAAAGAALFGTAPVTHEQLLTWHVDLGFAAAFLAATATAAAIVRRGATAARGSALAAGVAVMAATKATALVYAGVPIALAAAARRARRAARDGGCAWDRSPAVRVRRGVVGAAAAFVGAHWYVRNAIVLGNPLAPVTVRLGPWVLAEGYVERDVVFATTLAGVLDPRRRADWEVLGVAWREELGLLAPAAVLAGLVGLAGVVVAVARAPVRRVARAHRGTGALGLLALFTLVLYVVTPYTGYDGTREAVLTPWIGGQLRLALPAIGALAALAGGVLGALTAPWNARVACAVVAGALAGAARDADAAVAAAAGGAAGLAAPALAAAWARSTGVPSPTRRRVAWVGVASWLAIVPLAGATAARDRSRHEHWGGIVRAVDALPPGDVVGCVLNGGRGHVLLGSRLQRAVEFFRPVAPGTERDAWVAEARGRGVTVVALGPVPSWLRAQPEVGWVRAAGGPFAPLYAGDAHREPELYRLADAERAAPADGRRRRPRPRAGGCRPGPGGRGTTRPLRARGGRP